MRSSSSRVILPFSSRPRGHDYSFNEIPVRRELRNTEHYRTYKDFLNHRSSIV